MGRENGVELNQDFLILNFPFLIYLHPFLIFPCQGPAKEILSSNLKEERLVVEAPWMMYKKVKYQRRRSFWLQLTARVTIISSIQAAGISRPNITWEWPRVSIQQDPSLRGKSLSWRLTGRPTARYEKADSTLSTLCWRAPEWPG